MSDAEFLQRIAEDTGRVPTAIQSRPTLDLVEAVLWEAFQMLSPSRTATMAGPGAIPLSEIRTYMELIRMPPGDEQLEFLHLIRRMDLAYLELVTRK